MKIKTKIFLSYFISGLVLTILGAYVLYLVSANSLKESFSNVLYEISESRSLQVKSILNSKSVRAVDFSSDGFIKNSLVSFNSGINISNDLDRHLFINKLPVDNTLYEIIILDKNGQVAGTTNRRNLVKKDFSEDILFIEGKNGVYISDLMYDNIFSRNFISISAPVTLENNFLGVIIIKFDSKEINEVLLTRRELGETGESYLINQDKVVISPLRFKSNAILNEIINTDNANECIDAYKEYKLSSGDTEFHRHEVFEFIDYRGLAVLGTHSHVGSWCLLSEIGISESRKPLNNLLFATFVISLLIIFVAGIIAIVISKLINNPLSKFKKGMQILAAGDLNYKINIENNDEFGDLSREFNKISGALKESQENINLKVEEQTKELKNRETLLQEQQLALLNILDDAEEARVDLEKFKLAVENASDHIIITDSNGKIVYANKKAEESTGYSKQEMYGNFPNKKLWGGNMDKEFYEKMWDAIKSQKKAFSGKVKNRRKNGEYYTANVSIRPILSETNEILFFIGIERDITEEKQADQLKTDFISIASHQLRTPITAIRWVIETILSKEKNLSERSKDYLEDIRSSVKSLSRLVDVLLNISRIDSGIMGVAPQNIELVSFTKNIITEFIPLIESKKIKLLYEPFPEKIDIVSDISALRNIIQSLVSNAIEYSNDGGMVKISITDKGDKFLFEVGDNGIGIPKQEQKNMFKKFMRASNAKLVKTDGTGLGLFIVKRAVEVLDGKVWFDSEENKGTTFHVELPKKAKSKIGEKRFA